MVSAPADRADSRSVTRGGDGRTPRPAAAYGHAGLRAPTSDAYGCRLPSSFPEAHKSQQSLQLNPRSVTTHKHRMADEDHAHRPGNYTNRSMPSTTRELHRHAIRLK